MTTFSSPEKSNWPTLQLSESIPSFIVNAQSGYKWLGNSVDLSQELGFIACHQLAD